MGHLVSIRMNEHFRETGTYVERSHKKWTRSPLTPFSRLDTVYLFCCCCCCSSFGDLRSLMNPSQTTDDFHQISQQSLIWFSSFWHRWSSKSFFSRHLCNWQAYLRHGSVFFELIWRSLGRRHAAINLWTEDGTGDDEAGHLFTLEFFTEWCRWLECRLHSGHGLVTAVDTYQPSIWTRSWFIEVFSDTFLIFPAQLH